ncbi:MAG: O-antigen ligase family protein [Candidatus Coatesbacteria bacterium]|nr:O-antigen ligase family protein [Candidatus Coatesbacteria bacterium]
MNLELRTMNNRVPDLLQKTILLCIIVVLPFIAIPEALDGFILPKWFAIKLAALLLLIISLIDGCRKTPRFMALPLDLGAILLILSFGIAWTRSLGNWTGLHTPSQLLALWIIYRAIAAYSWDHRLKILAACVIPGVVLFSLAILSVLGGPYVKSGWLVAAQLGHGNYAGQWAILIAPVVAAFFFTARGRLWRAFFAVLLALSACYLLISNCRGAWVALAVATGVVWLVRRRSGSSSVTRRSLVPVLMILVLAVALLWQTGSFKERILTSFGRDDTGLSFRRLAWGSTLKMISHESVLGTGSGNFAAFYPRYRTSEERALFPQRRFVSNPHNSYLLAAAEAGPLGLAAIIFFVLAALRLALERARPDRGGGDIFDAALAVGVVATILHTVVSFNLEKPVSAFYFWAFAGVLSMRSRSGGHGWGVSGLRRTVRISLSTLAASLLIVVLVADCREIMASVHSPRGSMYKREGNLAEAERELRAAVELWPEGATNSHLLGRIMLQKGDLRSSEKLNEMSLSIWPYFRDALVDLGIIKWRQGDLRAAERFLVAAIDIDPEFSRGRIALGNLYAAHSEYDAAIEQYHHAEARRSSRESARYYIAAVHAARGRLDEALDIVEDLISLKHMYLDSELSIGLTADYLIDVIGCGEWPFEVVARDGDLWPVWRGEKVGRMAIRRQAPRIALLADGEGVEMRVSSDGERLHIRFIRAPDSRAHVYSIVVETPSLFRSFDLLADAELHSRILMLYAEILDSLGRHQEAQQMRSEALVLNPRASTAPIRYSETDQINSTDSE